jgi:hypothetical protein
MLVWISLDVDLIDITKLRPPEAGETVGGAEYERAKSSFEKKR